MSTPENKDREPRSLYGVKTNSPMGKQISYKIIKVSSFNQHLSQAGSHMKGKILIRILRRILIDVLGLVLACLLILFILWLRDPIWSIQFPHMPSDNDLINDQLDQKLPGYSNLTILDRQGKLPEGQRILTLRVSMDAGREPLLCEGKLKYIPGDPSYLNVTWNTLLCTGQDLLVRWAQNALMEERDNPCHQDKIASLLTYWVLKNKISVDKIVDQNLRSLVKNNLAEDKPIAGQILLLDLSKMRTKDFDPSLPNEQKVAQYVLRCDGTIDQYLAKENTTIFSQVNQDDGVYLEPPAERP